MFADFVEYEQLVYPHIKTSGNFDNVQGAVGQYLQGVKIEHAKHTLKPGEDAANCGVIGDVEVYAVDKDMKEIPGTRKQSQVIHYFTTNVDGKIVKWAMEFDSDHINWCRALHIYGVPQPRALPTVSAVPVKERGPLSPCFVCCR